MDPRLLLNPARTGSNANTITELINKHLLNRRVHYKQPDPGEKQFTDWFETWVSC